VAVISLGGIVTASSCRVAGDEINDSIVAMFKKEFNLDIGDNTAEEVKIQLGSAWQEVCKQSPPRGPRNRQPRKRARRDRRVLNRDAAYGARTAGRSGL